MIDPAYQPDPFEPAPGVSAVGGSGRLRDPSVTSDERTFALFEHLSFFAWLVWVPVIVTLILWLVKKGDSPFIDDHGRESINMQLSMLLYSLVGTVLGFLTCGVAWFVAGAILIAAIVFSILGAAAANRGEYYRYPAVIRFL